ncbi:hypothetical protein B0H10DRAFT_2032572 [Mycena sp. CBHHK59/15]|nr:hypothetical protein B0H10DRAFT_2032572 [Mycena sp. CBHHK59/15]
MVSPLTVGQRYSSATVLFLGFICTKRVPWPVGRLLCDCFPSLSPVVPNDSALGTKWAVCVLGGRVNLHFDAHEFFSSPVHPLNDMSPISHMHNATILVEHVAGGLSQDLAIRSWCFTGGGCQCAWVSPAVVGSGERCSQVQHR